MNQAGNFFSCRAYRPSNKPFATYHKQRMLRIVIIVLASFGQYSLANSSNTLNPSQPVLPHDTEEATTIILNNPEQFSPHHQAVLMRNRMEENQQTIERIQNEKRLLQQELRLLRGQRQRLLQQEELANKAVLIYEGINITSRGPNP